MKKLGLVVWITLLIVSCTNNQSNKETINESNSNENDLIKIVDRWNFAHNEKDVAVFSELYSKNVDFYKSLLSKNECIEKKIKLFKKHPDFYQQIYGKIEVINSDKSEIKLSFIKKVTIDGKTIDYPSYLLIKQIDGRNYIVTEGDMITDKNISKNKNTKENNKTIDNKTFIQGLSNVKQLTFKEASDGYDYFPNFPNNKLCPEKIQIFYNQLALDLKAVYSDKTRVRVPYSFDIGYETDGEMQWERNTNKYLLGQYDFDKDGIDEIVFAVQDNKGSDNGLGICIIKYFQPSSRQSISRTQNWEMIGSFSGKMILGEPIGYILNQSIKIPRNLRGFYYEWTYVKGKFIDTGDY